MSAAHPVKRLLLASGRALFRVGIVGLIAMTVLGVDLASSASARDVVVSDSSSPLNAAPGTPNFANTAVTPDSPAATQSGSCTTPNVSIRNSAAPGGPTAASDVTDAIQKAVTPSSMNIQSGDNLYFCDIAQSGDGAPATNTYAPAEAGTTGTAVDLSGTPGITIASFPGQNPKLRANADPADTDYSFFTDTSTQGRTFALRDLVLEQGPISTLSGGFIRISNAVTPGKLVIDGITADEFEVNSVPPEPDGGVIAAENVEVTDSSFGTNEDNSTSGDGGAIAADGDVLVRTSRFGSREQSSVNQAQADGGAIAAGGDVVVEGSVFEGNQAFADGGAIAARGRVEVTGTPSVFIGYSGGFSAGDNGGAIHAQSVLVANASRFGVDTAPEPDVGVGLEADGDGGAIATYNVTAGCNDASPATPCVPGVVEITGAATFGDNVADGNGGAIYAEGGVDIDGQTSGVRFISTPTFVNQAVGGGAIAVGGLFDGANTGPSPRVCVASSSLVNLNFTGQKAFGAGGGAVNVLPGATDLTDPTKRCNVELSGNTFTSNNADSGPGGALFIGGGNVTLADNVFDSNTTTTSGDGGAVATGGDGTNAARFPITTITGSEFTDNQSVARGGAVANAVSALNTSRTTVSDTLVSGNSAQVGGGGLSSTGPGSVTVTGSDFTDNTAGTTGSGGAAYIAGSGNATIDTTEFMGNEAGTTSGNGGAVSITTSGPTKTITENSFVSNEANGTGGGSGGAIYTQVGLGTTPGTFSDNLFAQNAATAAGGALLHQAAGNLTVEESIFRANYAVAAGGALGSTSGTLTVDQSEFDFNGTLGDGGALFGAGTRTVLDGSVFLENKAGVDALDAFITAGNAADGGAARITSATYRIKDSVFAENLAANDGGAVDVAANGSAAGDGIVSSEFALNEAGVANAAQTSVGGAASLSAFAQNVTESDFTANRASQTNTGAAATTRGGAIAATGGNLNLSRSTVSGNSASSAAGVTPGGVAAAGGGVYLASAHTVNSTNSTFTGNQAPIAAVAWSENTGSALDFTSSTIASNLAPSGSSILVSGRTSAGAIDATNSVISEGSANGSACLTGSGGTVVNGGGNVLTDTTACGGNALVGAGGAPAAKVTAAQLALSPLADNGGPTETMALGLGSVAAASAANNALGADPTDQRGLERPNSNQSSGAYQLTTVQLTISKTGTGKGTVTSDPAGIDCGPDCNSETASFAQQPPALTVTLTATPQAASVFVSWGGPCIPTGPNTCEVTLDEARFVTANFQDASRTLTVSRGGNGEGQVTSAPAGIDCGSQCIAPFEDGATVTLTAEPLGNSTFDGWSGACAASGNSPTCTLTMDASKTVTATFTQTARVKIKWNGDQFQVPKNRTVKVGQVICVNGNCKVVQATARVKAGGRAYRAKVQVNRDTFTTGQKRAIKVVVPKAAYKRLRKGRNSGKLNLVIRAEASVPGSFIEVNRSLGASLGR